jgi:hypothetical protein
MVLSGAELQVGVLLAVVIGVAGLLLTLGAGRDPYSEIGGGPLAMDVSDRVPVPPLDTPAGRVELEQLVAGINATRRERGEPPREVETEIAALAAEGSGFVEDSDR